VASLAFKTMQYFEYPTVMLPEVIDIFFSFSSYSLFFVCCCLLFFHFLWIFLHIYENEKFHNKNFKFVSRNLLVNEVEESRDIDFVPFN
jgi:hypothetical protein